MRSCSPPRLRSGLFLLALAGSVVPSAAAAQTLERFTLRGEGAAGFLLTSYQRDVLRDNLVGASGAVRLSFFVYDRFALQVSAGQWYFPSDTGGGGLVTASGGVRFEPNLSERVRLELDVNVGAGFTGPLTRFGADGGIGLEYLLTPAVGIGPVVRYQYLLRASQDVGESPQMISAGLSLSLRVPPARRAEPAAAPPPPPDTDRDGVLDASDHCPEVPAGVHPDANRPGCPVGDRDGDGVLDDADECVEEPAGAHPDANRPGCPVRDRDGDGVLDDVDQCSDVPAGAEPDPTRAGCPDGDDDHDGVANHRDQCAAEPAGLHPDPARAGCPLPDRDHDSVPDATDHCPDQPGAPSTDANRNGCPSVAAIEGGFVRIRQTVQFRTDSDQLRPVSTRILRGVADVLRATPEIRRVSIEGHTDDTGDAAHNQDLSERRARAVMQWLTAHGVESARLEVRGFGATRPLVAGNAESARRVNRRVDFRIVDPPMPEGAPSASSAPAPVAPAQHPAGTARPHRHHRHHGH